MADSACFKVRRVLALHRSGGDCILQIARCSRRDHLLKVPRPQATGGPRRGALARSYASVTNRSAPCSPRSGVLDVRFALMDIDQSPEGFGKLARLHAEAEELSFETIEIDMQETFRFEADMCAVLGAILYSLSLWNEIELINIQPEVKKILSKNGFLSHYGHRRLPDDRGTTISYQQSDAQDGRSFFMHIEEQFVERDEMPSMTQQLRDRFREGIFEIFSNAVLHSNTKLGVFSCGQFFPSKEALRFTVADLGVGIRENIRQKTGHLLSPEAAISWATRNGNTTKFGTIPGGLGLKRLRDFIDLNGGVVRIVSDLGYWERKNKKSQIRRLNHPFLGTIVSVEVDTSDERSYGLAQQVSVDNLL